MTERDPKDPLHAQAITHERWAAAQRWEGSFWVAEARTTKGRLRAALARVGLERVVPGFGARLQGSDWNEWWSDRFDGYSAIPHELNEVIELGCGPYTNVRLLARGRSIRRLVCSDPLISDYVRLRGCWVAEAVRRGAIVVDDHPAESSPFKDGQFDLTVLINVLDHVRDMQAVLDNAIRITRDDGLLILGQDLTDDEDARRIGVDLGHPIRVTHEMLEAALRNFDPIQHQVLPRSEGRNPSAHYGTFLFIGRRRLSPHGSSS